MSTTNSAVFPMRRAAGALLGGLAAGTLDIVYAFVFASQRGRSPLWVFQSVASGLLGRQAFDGGMATGIVGVICHFTIATIFATFFSIASNWIPALRRQPLICGALYGVGVWIVMNTLVLPLSAFPLKVSYPPMAIARGFVSHALLVGIPISYTVSRFTRSNS